MKYTVSLKADKKVEKDIAVINKIILEYWKPRAIVMFGGFGHGGGSFKKIGKKSIPLNDYDLYVITDKAISIEELEKVGKKCSETLGKGGKEIVEHYNEIYDANKFFHVDLHNVTYSNLKKLYPTQRAYDLKTSIVVWGDKNVLEKIPDIKISKSDAIRLLFNKLSHFAIAEGNSEIIKSIYAVKGLTDLCSALLIFEGKYVSRYQDRIKELKNLDIPRELKKLVEKATRAKLCEGYKIKDVEEFFKNSKKWVEWEFKRVIRKYLNIKSRNWKVICKDMYKKLPYIYFNDYLGSKYLFYGQYYLNIKFFLEGLRKEEFLIKSLLRWRDAGLIIAIALMLYSFGEETEAEKYLKKITSRTKPLRKRILKLYSVYYLQKLI